MNKLSFCAVGTLLFCPAVFSQTPDWGEGRTYNNAKVKLISGATFHAKHLSVGNSEVLLTAGGSPRPVAFPLKNVERVQIATGNHVLTGLGVGTLGGMLALIIIKETYEKPKTESYSEPGFSVTVTTKKVMDPGLKVLLVSLPVGLGALIGSAIPSRYKTIYSAAPAGPKVTWHFSPGQLGRQPALGMQVNF